MRLKGLRGSRNVEDRRGRGGAKAGIGGLGLLVVLVIGYFAGIDVTPLLNGQLGGGTAQQGTQRELTAQEREAGEFAAKVLGTTETVWGQLFPQDFGRP